MVIEALYDVEDGTRLDAEEMICVRQFKDNMCGWVRARPKLAQVTVTPANAGAQSLPLAGTGGNRFDPWLWIPAFAGMTNKLLTFGYSLSVASSKRIEGRVKGNSLNPPDQNRVGGDNDQ